MLFFALVALLLLSVPLSPSSHSTQCLTAFVPDHARHRVVTLGTLLSGKGRTLSFRVRFLEQTAPQPHTVGSSSNLMQLTFITWQRLGGRLVTKPFSALSIA